MWATRLAIGAIVAFVLGPALAHLGILPARVGFLLFGLGGLLGIIAAVLGIIGAVRGAGVGAGLVIGGAGRYHLRDPRCPVSEGAADQ